MDVLSMQAANRVLKELNTKYKGAYDVFIATEDQTQFTTEKAHDTTSNTLQVFVNGYHAVYGTDYSHVDNKTFKFAKGLRAGDVVLSMTQVAGVPVFEGTPYDDTEVKSLISDIVNNVTAIEEKITVIETALDEDGDGSILDTIADIKKQWGDADETLKGLIDLKATTESLTELATRVTTIEGNTSTGVINDTVTGRPYALQVTNGVLSAVLIGTVCVMTIDSPNEAVSGTEFAYDVNIDAGCDAGGTITFEASATGCSVIRVTSGYDGICARSTSGDTASLSFQLDALDSRTVSLSTTPNGTGTQTITARIIKNGVEIATATHSFEVAPA